MRKRTRIFALVSLLAGLMLGVGIFLATLAPANAAAPGKHRGGGGGKTTVTSTVTNTVTSTVTNTVTSTVTSTTTVFAGTTTTTVFIGQTGSCTVTPNPTHLSAGGNADFVLNCTGLSANAAYHVDDNTSCGGHNTGAFVSDAQGRAINIAFHYTGCSTGHFTFTAFSSDSPDSFVTFTDDFV